MPQLYPRCGGGQRRRSWMHVQHWSSFWSFMGVAHSELGLLQGKWLGLTMATVNELSSGKS
jgi:hypothetical protein